VENSALRWITVALLRNALTAGQRCAKNFAIEFIAVTLAGLSSLVMWLAAK
jgi:hypothetical protein